MATSNRQNKRSLPVWKEVLLGFLGITLIVPVLGVFFLRFLFALPASSPPSRSYEPSYRSTYTTSPAFSQRRF